MLEQQILNDYKQAMKDKNQIRVQTISFLRSELKYAAINSAADTLSDEAVLAVIRKLIKQRRDSIEQFTIHNRPELAEKEQAELAVLQSYLPPELDSAEIERIVEQIINETGSTGMNDMGRVMKAATEKTQKRCDGATLSRIVKEKLSRT